MGEPVPSNTAVIGAFNFVLINFTYSNKGSDPALHASITFSIPERYTFFLDMSNNVSFSHNAYHSMQLHMYTVL